MLSGVAKLENTAELQLQLEGGTKWRVESSFRDGGRGWETVTLVHLAVGDGLLVHEFMPLALVMTCLSLPKRRTLSQFMLRCILLTSHQKVQEMWPASKFAYYLFKPPCQTWSLLSYLWNCAGMSVDIDNLPSLLVLPAGRFSTLAALLFDDFPPCMQAAIDCTWRLPYFLNMPPHSCHRKICVRLSSEAFMCPPRT